MKNTYTFILLLIFTIAIAQPPPTYYNNATGTGFILKTQLKTIITNGHNDQGYDSLWGAFATTDRDFGIGYESDNTIVDIYSENPSDNDSYNFAYQTNQCGSYSNEGDCYNREHLVPQAYFENVQISPMKNDPFHVMPTDGKVNGMRDNFPFGVVNSASYTSANGSKKGNNLNSGYSAGYTATVFEPIDEFKGDIARSLLYFATRYEDLMDDFYTSATVQSKNMFDGSTNQVFSPTFMNILLTWNSMDPVSIKETKRNNAIYAYQGNRNPYIDNNNYVTAIWGLPLEVAKNESNKSINIYPNPSINNKINIQSAIVIDEISLYNLGGQLILRIQKPAFDNNTYTLENLKQGFYILKMKSNNQFITKKVLVN
jgi:endonuclease I